MRQFVLQIHNFPQGIGINIQKIDLADVNPIITLYSWRERHENPGWRAGEADQ